jgi:superfamily II DNA or RNA helicase
MTIVLRDYQESALAAIEDSWSTGINRPAVVAATGAGKTSIFSALIGRHVEKLRANGQRVLVLAHRDTLLEQGDERIKLQNPGIWTAIVKGSRGQKTHQFADVVIASVQTLARPKRREAIDRIGLVIVDECHLAASKSYRDVLDHYGCFDERQTPTVGFTATLTRMNGGLPDVWQSVAYEKGIASLIAEGFLVPPVAKSVDAGLNLATTRVTAGDLDTKDLARALEDSAAFDTIADVWTESASDRPTIAFLPNVETTHKLRDAFLARGVAAESVIGATPATERRAAFERYRTGVTQVLTSCMTLTEGFDAPSTSCVIIGRPTINPGLFIQMVGRGLRLAPGKADCLILDIAGASLKHNLAGVNDLESDCLASCGCDCLSCGCGGRCKCGIRQCGCACIEQHESAQKPCCEERCECGCEGELPDGGVHCICNLNPDCACKGEGPILEDKEISAEVLRNLIDVDVLGEELAQSSYTWLATAAGIRFLAVAQTQTLFLLPSPDGDGYFQGLVNGDRPDAPVTRLDTGALPADAARKSMEEYADGTGWTYSNKKASWRRGPASEAQRGLLARLGARVPDQLTKGAASDLLSVTKISRCLDHRFSRYVQSSA